MCITNSCVGKEATPPCMLSVRAAHIYTIIVYYVIITTCAVLSVVVIIGAIAEWRDLMPQSRANGPHDSMTTARYS